LPTGTVNVHADGSFDIVRNVAWESIQIPESLPKRFDMLYFGTSAQSSQNNRVTLEKLLKYNPRHVFLDLNLRKNCYTKEIIIRSLEAATILKMNSVEWNMIRELYPTTSIEDLMNMHDLEMIALTHGKKGASIYIPGDTREYRPSPVKTIDATGAGDAFSAVLASGILIKANITNVLASACHAGANTVSKKGAMTPLPTNIKNGFLP
jgi:fructokinase